MSLLNFGYADQTSSHFINGIEDATSTTTKLGNELGANDCATTTPPLNRLKPLLNEKEFPTFKGAR